MGAVSEYLISWISPCRPLIDVRVGDVRITSMSQLNLCVACQSNVLCVDVSSESYVENIRGTGIIKGHVAEITYPIG